MGSLGPPPIGYYYCYYGYGFYYTFMPGPEEAVFEFDVYCGASSGFLTTCKVSPSLLTIFIII
jgi:hypothetical protein